MLNYYDVINIIKNIVPLGITVVNTIEAYSYILADDVTADTDVPPFSRSTMDGYGIISESYHKNIPYKIIDIKTAGDNKTINDINIDECIKIMTGANVPDSIDCVIPVEYSNNIDNNLIKFNIETVTKNMNIIRKGTDALKDDVIIKKNKQLFHPDLIPILYTGNKTIPVFKKPDCCILTTGDELIDIDQKIQGNQVRDINRYLLESLLNRFGYNLNKIYNNVDEKHVIYNSIEQAKNNCDVLITVGGISMGDKDYVRDILLNDPKYEQLFYKVLQKPGKPVMLSKRKNQNKYILSLPGNPLAVFSSFFSIGIPFFKKLSGYKNIENIMYQGILENDYYRKGNRLHFVPVNIKYVDNQFFLEPYSFTSSGDVISIINSNGFFIADYNKSEYKKGDKVKFILIT